MRHSTLALAALFSASVLHAAARAELAAIIEPGNDGTADCGAGDIDMALYLVLHGKADLEGTGPGRGLSHEGAADVTRIAGVARGYGIVPTRILHSGKTHAKETAKLLAAELVPPGGMGVRNGLGPDDDVAAVLAYLDPAEDLMLVGHQPFLERLLSMLIVGTPDKLPLKLQPAGIVALDRDRERRLWFVKWALQPRIE